MNGEGWVRWSRRSVKTVPWMFSTAWLVGIFKIRVNRRKCTSGIDTSLDERAAEGKVRGRINWRTLGVTVF